MILAHGGGVHGQASAVRLELLAADMVQERLSHLAAGAVMNADKKDLFLRHKSKGI